MISNINTQKPIKLGVNIDHIATLRQARLTTYPDLIKATLLVEKSGADSITLHLREDRRHIQDDDVFRLKETITSKMNLEMAATDEMLDIACQVKPEDCCLVPEKRQELTTEGGLDVVKHQYHLRQICTELNQHNICVSLFVDANIHQIETAKKIGASVVELHTGYYANAKSNKERKIHLNQLQQMAAYANSIGLQVNAGHGLTVDNVYDIALIPQFYELNIGHALIADALFVGLEKAIQRMKDKMLKGRRDSI